MQSPTHRRVHRSISATSTNPSRRASSGGEILRIWFYLVVNVIDIWSYFRIWTNYTCNYDKYYNYRWAYIVPLIVMYTKIINFQSIYDVVKYSRKNINVRKLFFIFLLILTILWQKQQLQASKYDWFFYIKRKYSAISNSKSETYFSSA